MRVSRDLRQALGIFGTILVAALLIGVLSEPGRARAGSFVGTVAPDLVGTTIDGTRVGLADLRGRPVWLTFFSSWCVRCRAENPDIEQVHLEQARAGGDLVILAIGSGETGPSVSEYARNARLTFPIVADPDRAISRSYAVLALPTHVFIDRDGIVRDIRIGVLQPELMRELVARLGASGR
ncbi:MAG: TlpA family protein disulfide reductase [Chloroflexi bacterium]|nr:TlpA family protein disulfide reductase [Chloroflexota bacterium]